VKSVQRSEEVFSEKISGEKRRWEIPESNSFAAARISWRPSAVKRSVVAETRS
jgi:hypothetical protein